MKTNCIIITAMLVAAATAGFGQDISQREVPSLILNNFKVDFPRAMDIEWEKKGELYQVEFELDKNKDQEIWYDELGTMTRQEMEISTAEVPAEILAAVQKEFAGFKLDEAKKILENGRTEYHLDLESRAEDWDVVFAPNGKILSKKPD